MELHPTRVEIDHRTIKMLVGVIAIAAVLIPMFTCGCDGHAEIIPGVHYLAASAMFLVLAFFCWRFLRRAWNKKHGQAKARAAVYALCGAAILVSILALALNAALHGRFSAAVPTFVYWFEAAGLVAFGVSWLTASHVLPVINEPRERFSPLRRVNPPDQQIEG